MRKSAIYNVTILAVFFFAVVHSSTAFSDDNTKQRIVSSYRQGADVCNTVTTLLGQELAAREIVKTGIQLGHSPCIVVKCALHEGAKLDDVITGALEGGARTDVLSRCAIDAGADPKDVASAIFAANQLLACAEPASLMEIIDIGPPNQDNRGGGPVSPYKF